MVGAVLLLRVMHAVRVSRGSVSEGSVRPGEEGPARGGDQVRADESGGSTPDERVPAGAADAIAAPAASGGVRGGNAVSEGGVQPSGSADQDAAACGAARGTGGA